MTDSELLTPNATTRLQGPRFEHAPEPARVALPAARYEVRDRIGAGGMGEVIGAYDERIGREVAIKRMRTQPTQDSLARFVREARIQGRLDHPAIVPVHELATDEEGLPYFTMKRISGQTLERRAKQGAPLHELLRAFVDVCRAVAFAHSRGVVHRDLKPANVMLGDYGEVYVLDWGIARVVGEIEIAAVQCRASEHTQPGTVMGTPGYIAPELYGNAVATPASDVYALGAILFELLSSEPLHGHTKPAIVATVMLPQDHPSRRRPERAIPPELDELCFEALSPHPGRRPASHELADRVQAYLDGDRDLDRRRELAASQLRSAYDALSSGTADARIVALRRASRALALDPESRSAAGLVSSLLITSPDPIPPQLAARLDDHDRDNHRDRSRKAICAYFALSLLLPLVFVLDVRDWWWVVALVCAPGLGIAASIYHLWRGRPSVPLVVLTTLVITVVFSRVASPFVMAPLVVVCALIAITTIPWFTQRTWAVVAWTITAVMLPFVLEWTGVLAPTWTIADGGLLITGDVFVAHGRGAEIALVIATLVCALIGGLLALGLSRRQRSAQRQLSIQAWHLGYLVPRAESRGDEAARSGSAP
jgi:serine/threonine-protein kinase